MKKYISIINLSLILLLLSNELISQSVIINEVAHSGSSFINEQGESTDWIELYNASTEKVSLEGWTISDDKDNPTKSILPAYTMEPKEYIVISASGQDTITTSNVLYFRTALKLGDSCKYILPTDTIPENWTSLDFDDDQWQDGITGIGYGDEDDATVISETSNVVFLRQEFTVPEFVLPLVAEFYVDYDDAFIAYINGVEIARSRNIESTDTPPFNVTVTEEREAQLYQGGNLERYIRNIFNSAQEGKNVLSIEVHNKEQGSPDLSFISTLLLRGTAPISNICNGPAPELRRPSSGLHTNFKLKATETLYLYDSSGELQDSMYLPVVRREFTVGRLNDSIGMNHILAQTSPCETNPLETIIGFIDKPVIFSHESSISEEPIELELSGADEGEVIRYTIDGKDVDAFSPIYTRALPISQTTTIKAGIFKEGYLPNKINAHTYLFNIQHNLPIISLTIDEKDFFDGKEGIYVEGDDFDPDNRRLTANYFKDIEKPILVSYFDKNGENGFTINAGTKIFGAGSRHFSQKSLSFFFRSSYGASSLNYPLFSNRQYDTFEAFVLRNSGNDWQDTMIRDLTLTGLMMDSNVDVQAGYPVATYLNGTYWGLYNIREKINEHYLSSLHNIPSEDITVLEAFGALASGTERAAYLNMIEFVENENLGNEDNYQLIIEQIDIKNYIQYQVAEIYFDNTDWPGNNIRFWKSKEGKWRWILFDTDSGFGRLNTNDYLHNTMAYATQSSGPVFHNPPWSTLLLRKLLSNEGFKNTFINTFADELNTRFLPENVNELITANANRINQEMDSQIERWGETNKSRWENRVESMKNFARRRPTPIRRYIQEHFNLPAQNEVQLSIDNPETGSINLNSINIQASNWSGIYFESIPITLTAKPQPGYSFDHWSGSISSNDISVKINPNRILSITAHFILSDPELAERDILFNEINYNSSEEKDAGDWVELYNNGPNSQDLSNWAFKDSNDEHLFLIPEGTILMANDYLVLTEDTEKFEEQYPDISNKVGDFDFKLSSNGEFIRLYDNNNLLVDSLWYLPVNDWPIAANGTGATLELIDPDVDNTSSENWESFTFYGTPGTQNGNYITPTTDINNNRAINIRPNPFIDRLYLDISTSGKVDLNVQLVDVVGRKIARLYQQPIQGVEKILLSMPNIPSGIYFLKIKLGTEEIVKKIIRK